MPNTAVARSVVMASVAASAARFRAAASTASAIAAAAAFTALAALLPLPATAAGASAAPATAPAPARQPAAEGWPAGGEARLLRYPAIHGDKIAFVYAGDIWLVDAAGGVARRLTSHPGLELFPRFSPDGRWIAFTGEYGGNRQVFVISVDGGAPRQLTYHNDIGDLPPRGGYDNQVLGWTPDGKDVVFRANRV
ncbi:MAG TPA: hypothetical protein VHB47_19570, partial [Thermoanaerobaculia bacterium]|nr:hypothetical protein [Thermoanaerobaculia bacterium]